TAHRRLAPDLVAFPELDSRDRLLRLAHARLLPGDDREVRHRAVEQRTLLCRAADAHVDDDLDEPRHFHDVRQPELTLELILELGLEARLEARALCGARGHQTSVPHLRQMRRLEPPPPARRSA